MASTASTAIASGYTVTVPGDATASVAPGEHADALEGLRRAGANVIDVAQILS